MRTLLDIIASYLGIGRKQFQRETQQRAVRWGLSFASVTQLAESRFCKPRVASSILAAGSILAVLLLCAGCATRQSTSSADFPRSCVTPWDICGNPWWWFADWSGAPK